MIDAETKTLLMEQIAYGGLSHDELISLFEMIAECVRTIVDSLIDLICKILSLIRFELTEEQKCGAKVINPKSRCVYDKRNELYKKFFVKKRILYEYSTLINL